MIPITVSYPAVAAEWHPTKNGSLTPEMVSAGMTRKVWWLCPKTCSEGCAHEWEAYIGNRCKGNYGCPFCSSFKQRVCIHTSIVGTHPDVAAQWHPTKNGDRRPEQYSYGSEQKAWWLCPNTCPEGCPHEWEADISKRILRGVDAGCPFCASNHKHTCIHTSIVTTHPHLVAQWHPTKNGDLRPERCTSGCNEMVWWRCPNMCEYGCEHEWRARICHRVAKDTDCPFCCSFRQRICKHQSIAYTHPHLLDEWHPSLNSDLKPELFPSGSEKRIWWRCLDNSSHIWLTSIGNRTYGRSECPHCKNKTEGKLFEYIHERYPSVKRQLRMATCKKRNYLPFDFFIPERNVIIEMDGGQHFKQVSNWLSPEETLRRDIFKMQKAEEAGYRVIRVLQEDVYRGGREWFIETLLPEIERDTGEHYFIASKSELYDKHKALISSGERIEWS